MSASGPWWPADRRSAAWTWGAALAAAAGLSAYHVLEGWLFDVHDAGGRLVGPSRGTVAGTLWWFGWALIAPLLLATFRRLRPDPARTMRTVARHVGAAVALAIVRGLVVVPAWLWYMHAPPPARYGHVVRVLWWTVLSLPTGVLQCLAFALAFHAVHFARALRDRELAAARLSTQLAHAELRALKRQLEPHFLFNTLNAIAGYVRPDPAAAERMIGRLGALLRLMLQTSEDRGAAHEIPLAREMELVEQYLELHRLRFGDRLEVRLHVAPETHDATVPALVLQPLVENALTHGVGARPGRALVEVRAERDADSRMLRLRVRDAALDEPASERAARLDAASSGIGNGIGIGLANTRARLTQIYGTASRLTLTPTADGTVAEVVVPFRTAGAT